MHVTVVQLVMFHGNSTLNNNILISLGGEYEFGYIFVINLLYLGVAAAPKQIYVAPSLVTSHKF